MHCGLFLEDAYLAEAHVSPCVVAEVAHKSSRSIGEQQFFSLEKIRLSGILTYVDCFF
jgi:hypothetical protein